MPSDIPGRREASMKTVPTLTELMTYSPFLDAPRWKFVAMALYLPFGVALVVVGRVDGHADVADSMQMQLVGRVRRVALAQSGLDVLHGGDPDHLNPFEGRAVNEDAARRHGRCMQSFSLF